MRRVTFTETYKPAALTALGLDPAYWTEVANGRIRAGWRDKVPEAILALTRHRVASEAKDIALAITVDAAGAVTFQASGKV